MIVINQGRVNYRYKISEEGPVIYDTIMSNRVVTCVVDMNLSANKEVDKSIAFVYDILTYTINITNVSLEKVENIVLKDTIPEGTSFIEDSVKINGIIQYGETPEELYVGSLQSYGKMKITFEVIIIGNCNNYKDEIINSGTVCYDFRYNIEKEPLRMCLLTNTVTTYVRYNIFTQISVSSSITICLRCCEKLKICALNTYPQVLKRKTIKTNTGTKLLVIWEIKYCLYYLKYYVNFKYVVCSDVYKEYFSTLLDIPCEEEYYNNDNLKIINESCTYNYVDDYDKLIICNTVLIIKNNC